MFTSRLFSSRPRAFRLPAVLLTAVLLFAGCMAEIGTNESGGSAEPGWDYIQANILETNCVTCHSGGSPPKDLALTFSEYQTIVADGKLSVEVPELKIIEPGDRTNSYLFLKITGDPAISGSRMPLGGQLGQADIDMIGAWIDAGAPEVTTGDPPPGDPPSNDLPPGGGETSPNFVQSWYGIQANVLKTKCVICHGGAAPPMGLSWEVGQYDAIVTGAMLSSTGVPIIDPGNSQGSYLMQKLAGTAGGARMPIGQPPLDQSTIDAIAAWIDNGAPLGVPEDANGGGGGTPPGFPPGTWLNVQANVFQVCVMCHNSDPDIYSAKPPKGLILEPDNYAGVVNGSFISPFDLDGSKIWRMITETDPDERMPLGLPPLTAEQLRIVGEWIDAGAPE